MTVLRLKQLEERLRQIRQDTPMQSDDPIVTFEVKEGDYMLIALSPEDVRVELFDDGENSVESIVIRLSTLTIRLVDQIRKEMRRQNDTT